MGLSIAHHLAAAGVRPLLLERHHLGAGSTGKSGAILRQHYSLALTAAMARDSLRVYAEFDQRFGGGAGFRRTGMALIVRGADRPALEANLALQRDLGVRTELLEGAALAEALPGAAVGEDVVGCFEPDAGFADPLATVATLAGAVRRAGGHIREGAEVLGLDAGPSAVRGVRLAHETIGADRVVVAAGPWAARVMRWVGWDAAVEARRVQCAVFRRPVGFAGGPVLIDFPNDMYAKHAGETHVGSIAPEETEGVDPDAYDEGVDGAYVRLAHARVIRRLPPLASAPRFGGYGALYAVTPDWHPVVGQVGPQGMYLCAGFSGHGFKLAPAIGATVAAELSGAPPRHDLAPLRPERFRDGRRVSGRYQYSIIG